MSSNVVMETLQKLSENAAEKTPETFETLFSKYKEDVVAIGNLYRNMKSLMNKLERQHAIEVKAALKAKAPKKPKEPREKVPMPVPQLLAKHFGIQEKMLDRDELLHRAHEYLRANCEQEKIVKEPNEKGKKSTETCYVANKLCETLFSDVKEGDLIPVLIVNSKVKGACERDPAFAKYKEKLDEKKRKEKEAAAAAKKEAAAAKKAAAAEAKKSGSKKSKAAPEPAKAASVEEEEYNESDAEEAPEVQAPVKAAAVQAPAKSRVVRKK